MYARILVPLDGSEFSEAVLPLAASVAHRLGAAVRLVNVVTAPLIPMPGELGAVAPTLDSVERRVDARTYLEQTAAAMRQDDVAVEVEVLEGKVVDALLECAEARGAGMIVMATHGRGGVQRMVMGSVADALVARSPIPVLAVPPGASVPAAEAEPIRMLVPLDGSERDEEILSHARVLSRALAAELHLVRVLVPVMDEDRMPVQQIDRVDLRDRRASATAYLDHFAATLERQGFVAVPHVVVDEDPSAAILAHATEIGADVIAMATRGLRGWDRVVAGSVADEVLQGSRKGVLLVRSP